MELFDGGGDADLFDDKDDTELSDCRRGEGDVELFDDGSCVAAAELFDCRSGGDNTILFCDEDSVSNVRLVCD